MSKPLNSSSSPTYSFPHPTPPREIVVPVCAGVQVEFSLLGAAQVPVQGSPHGLGELAVHPGGKAHEERGCPAPPAPPASRQFLKHRDVRVFPSPCGF